MLAAKFKLKRSEEQCFTSCLGCWGPLEREEEEKGKKRVSIAKEQFPRKNMGSKSNLWVTTFIAGACNLQMTNYFDVTLCKETSTAEKGSSSLSNVDT